MAFLVAGTIAVSSTALAQDEDASDPLNTPYQDEERLESSDGAKVGDGTDFFDTLDFLEEGKNDGSEDDLNLENLPEVAVSGGLGDETPGWDVAVFRGLDKVTARVWLFEAPINQPVMFGRFEVTVRRCNKQPPEETPNTTAFVQVDERQLSKGAEAEIIRVFNGWMFASSPGLNAVEHPVYDVWLIDCKMAEPSADTGIKENVEASADSDIVPAASSLVIAD